MTPSPLLPLRTRPHGPDRGTTSSGLGRFIRSSENRTMTRDHGIDDLSSLFVTITTVWYLATCHRCGPDLAQPFTDLVERDEWAVKHAESSGHVVHLSIDGEATDGHHAMLLRYFAYGAFWRWMCPAPACSRWNGPYDSGQLALASWRSHGGSK